MKMSIGLPITQLRKDKLVKIRWTFFAYVFYFSLLTKHMRDNVDAHIKYIVTYQIRTQESMYTAKNIEY